MKKLNGFLTWSRSGRELSPAAARIGLILCVMLAVTVRLVVRHVEPTLSRDSVKYVQVAQEIQRQRHGADKEKVFIPAMATPYYIYSAYLSLAPASLSPAVFGTATNILLGSLLPLVLGCAAWLLWKRNDLVVACAALFAVFPKFVDWSVSIQREIPYLFFTGCFLLAFLLYCRKKTWVNSFAVGATMALSFICRYEGAELFFIFAAAWGVLWWKNPGERRFVLAHGAWALLVSVAVFSAVLYGIGCPPADFLQFTWRKCLGYLVRIV